MIPPCTPDLGGTMQRRIIAIISATAVAVAGAITGLVVWLSQPSYDDIARACVKALKVRPEGDKAKPKACNGLKEDDYQTLLMAQVIDDLGWTDDEGNFDKNKMLDDTLNDTP
jgi:hypothetical protein